MILWFSYLAAATVACILVCIVLLQPWMMVRPSVLFLGFFWIQVQFAAAVNASYIYAGLDRPWALAFVVHGFALGVAAVILLTFRKVSRKVADRLVAFGSQLNAGETFARIVVLLVAEYLVVALYLAHVPFSSTGFYALIFDPDNLDTSRELSLKLIDSRVVAYAFTIMEKVFAPLAAAFAGALTVKAMREGRAGWLVAALACLPMIGFPTLLYGARGPVTMVVLAYLVTILLLNWRALQLQYLAGALLVCLLPIMLISTLKSEATFLFHAANILDRAVGRGYVDNVWHLSHVERQGYFGIAGIEKLAPLFGVEPRDMLNTVGREYGGRVTSTGLAILNVSEPPIACEIRLNCEDPRPRSSGSPELFSSASSGASFATLNFAMFGYWSLPFSVMLVLSIDLLLYVYLRLPASVLPAVVGAIAVPVLNLCFSFFTTVLASKGLLLIPACGWLMGSVGRLTGRAARTSSGT